MEYKESFDIYEAKQKKKEKKKFIYDAGLEDKAFSYSALFASNLFEEKQHKELYQIGAGFLAYKVIKEILKWPEYRCCKRCFAK